MKIQSLAVIFAIIVLPIIIILSYYIHKEVDTIALQTSYDTKLIDATHDAMAAFEINTANENLSSVADALRSIIDASTNVFFNSLATNLGMSNANREFVQSYIPSILYTLYDGYYIYSPTRTPEVKVDDDGNVEYDITGQMQYKTKSGGWSTNLDDNTYYKQDYVLKSYMPYSARYKDEDKDYDITINYTLDNYITIMGNIGKVYYSKTGYLIGKDVITCASAEEITDLLSYNEVDAEDICLSGTHKLILIINPYLEDGNRAGEIVYSYTPYIDSDTGEQLNYVAQKEKLTKYYENIESYYNEYRSTVDEPRKAELLDLIKETNNKVQNIESSLENLSAITYYVKAQIFSNWVYSNLGNEPGGLAIEDGNISNDLAINNNDYTIELSGDLPAFYHDFSGSTNVIFDKDQNPENLSSNFVSHKFDVIKNSIQYNLNLALSVYDLMAGEMDIKMPVISDTEWEKILQNVSIVTFMQGFNCGLKYYNNYAIISSTNNEITVIPNEIYYVKKTEYNTGDLAEGNPLYHRIDCPELDDSSDDFISFRSKEVKYDKIYDKNTGRYKYDHKNFACYNCIVGRNYLKKVKDEAGNIVDGYSNNIILSALSDNRKKVYYRAVAKAREMIYKTNALTDSNGYETLYTTASDNSTPILGNSGTISIGTGSTKKIQEIKAIEVTVKSVHSTNKDDSTAVFTAKVNEADVLDYYGNQVQLFLNFQETPQTITIPIHADIASNLSSLSLVKQLPTEEVTAYLLNVRVIYE